ncbi:MAG: hypothetical protein IRZ33_02420 [Alicyclobacillaceae bacterium]|nr:hypothetical protein [Alicyclobacillaceae bacterium]
MTMAAMSAQADSNASAERAMGQAAASSWKMKLAWIVFAGVVPLMVTAAMLGIAMQFVGVPVWQTVMHAFDAGKAGSSHHSPAPGHGRAGSGSETLPPNTQLSRKLAALESANQQLKRQLASARAAARRWEMQVESAKAQSLMSSRATASYHREAAILTEMDPGKAAQLLAKLPPNTAAGVLASMSPGDVADILGQMDADTAARLLGLTAAGNGLTEGR